MGKETKAVIGAITLVVLVALIIVITQLRRNSIIVKEQSGDIFCATDVRQCSDGSYVSRVPPACEFRTCPNVTATATNTN